MKLKYKIGYCIWKVLIKLKLFDSVMRALIWIERHI